MKEQDNLYCIKTLKANSLKANSGTKMFNCFTKNKIYKIFQINKYRIKVIDNLNEFWFFSIDLVNNDKYKFNDYFVSLKKYRKLKLKKINTVN